MLFRSIGNGSEWADEEHEDEYADKEGFAWAWDGERIMIEEGHDDMDGFRWDNTYHGRYENVNGVEKVSIHVPKSKQNYKIPNSLIRLLTREFGDNAHMYIF